MSPVEGGRPGWVEKELAEEFPGLSLSWLAVPGRAGPSPPSLRRRLRALADGYRGASVVAMRTQLVPSAFRAFYRQIGLDPDVDRTPAEQTALSRLMEGGFRSVSLIADALLIALVETGVAVWALDADAADGETLGLRVSRPGERLGGGAAARELAPGRLVVADRARPCALLFGEIAPECAVRPATGELVLFAVGVPGVPAIHVEEALWLAGESIVAEGAA